MADDSIDILLRLQDELSPALAKAQALIRETAKDLVTTGSSGASAFKGMETSSLSLVEALMKIGPALGLSLGIGSIVAFGKALLDDADSLMKLYDTTGISVEALQRMRIAGDDAGVALDAMTKAVTMLQKRLGGDDASAAAALRDFGINIEHFKQLDASQQMAAISAAVQATHDPLRVATDLSGLFGKSWAEMLPVLKRGFKEVTDQSTVMSGESVKALDDFGDAAGRFWRATKGAFGEALADVLTLSLSDLRQLNSELKNLPTPPDSSRFANFYRAIVPPELPKDLDDITRKLDAQIEAQIKTSTAMVELNSVGVGWRGTLDTINGAVAQAIRYYLDAGVSQEKLATVYGLTAAQVKSVASALTEEQTALKLQAASIEQVTMLWDEYTAAVSDGGTELDRQVAAIDRWAQDLMAKAQKAGTDTKEFYEALTALWTQKLQAASLASSDAIQETADDARSLFALLNDDVMGITSEFYGWNDAIMTVTRGLDGAIESARQLAELRAQGNSLDLAHAARDPEIMELLKQGWSLENAEAIKLARQWGYTPKLYDPKGNPETSPSPGERVPGYAAGVRNAPGGLAWVGELGPELMRVPRGADIYPTGTGPGGTTVVQHIYITQPLGTPTQIAKALDDATMQRQRNIGVRY